MPIKPAAPTPSPDYLSQALPLDRITPGEWRWAGGWAITVLVLSCLPYLIALLAAPPDWQFAGILVNPFDGHSYLAKIRQGLAGNWLFQFTYTPEPHEGVFIFTFYLALGHLAALTHLSPVLMFHLARLISGLGLLLTAFRFIAWVTPHSPERRLAFGLLLTASGLGWLGSILGAFPIDLWVPEAFVPYSLYTNPHFPLGLALMLVIFQQFLQLDGSEFRVSSLELPVHSESQTQSPILKPQTSKPETPNPQTRNPKPQTPNLWASLAALGLAVTLPFALLAVLATLTVSIIWLYLTRRRLPWPHLWLTLGVGLFAAPLILYDYWVSTYQPVLAGWTAQNVTPAPAPLDLLLGYGLVGLLAIAGGWQIARQGPHGAEPGPWLVLWWAIITLILVYLPFDLQRRLISGLHIPLCILAALGLKRWLTNRRLKLSYRRRLTAATVALGGLGTLFVWSLPLLAMLQSPATSETTALFFIRREEALALAWLREHTRGDEVVLASPRLGMFIPGQTGLRTFYGHPFETIEAKTKKAQVEAFYQGRLDQVPPWVDIIIYGPTEQALGRPQILSALPVLFSTDNLLIYKAQK